jgi:multidrug efflux system membrane fusion protein
MPRLSLRLVVAPLLFVTACGRGQGSGPAQQGGGAVRALPVKAALVQIQDVVHPISALGTLEADELIQVTAEVEGAVADVRFREGDRVTPQTLLLLIDPERYRLEAQRAEANYKKALADQTRAESDLKRREDLGAQQLLSAEELNRSRQEFERLAAEAAAAKAAFEIAAQNQRRSEVRPKQSGVINQRLVDTGQFVRTGTNLATLVDVTRLRLRFKISEAESLQARKGQDFRFRVPPLGERDFSGRIYHVGEVADTATRQVEVLAWVSNPGALKPGFFAEVTLPTETRKGVLVVPETAIQASERGFISYTLEEGKARLRPVQLGLRTGNGGVEILSGLKPGEVVITEGSDRLADGVSVRATNHGEDGEELPSGDGKGRGGERDAGAKANGAPAGARR